MATSPPDAMPHHHEATRSEKLVITASSLGTVFEWYDFYLYGLLTTIIAAQFLTGLNPTTSFIMALLVFAAGFLVRPFGALVFGRIGDMVGRRYTFILTLLVEVEQVFDVRVGGRTAEGRAGQTRNDFTRAGHVIALFRRAAGEDAPAAGSFRDANDLIRTGH